MDMVADVGADNVVVHLDTYHMNIEEASVQRAVKLCGDKLGCALTTGSPCSSRCTVMCDLRIAHYQHLKPHVLPLCVVACHPLSLGPRLMREQCNQPACCGLVKAPDHP